MFSQEILECPECGFEYIHLVAIRVLRQREVTEITAKGITIKDDLNKTRGVIIELDYLCENDHYGTITLNFHEGQTLLSHKLHKLPTDLNTLPDIWRD